MIVNLLSFTFAQAFSKVVQKLVPQLPALENLLDILIQVSHKSITVVTLPLCGW